MNDPNWRFHDVYDEKRTNITYQAVVEAAGPFIPVEKPGQKKVKDRSTSLRFEGDSASKTYATHLLRKPLEP